MKSNTRKLKRRLAIVLMSAVTLVGLTLLAAARTPNAISITVRNSAHRDIRHLYLAAGDPNNWGPDQLGGSVIATGASYTLSDVACNGASVRVIAEDGDGCFTYYNAACDADQTWEVTDASARDCGY